MATGYTHAVQSGKETSLRAFALSCARAFGALMHMRDDSTETEIRPREYSDFYDRRLKEERGRLEELLSVSSEQAAVLAEAERQSSIKSWEETAEQRQAERERYEAMLAKAQAWSPPTAQHVALKEFMVEQLNSSIEFDCADMSGWKPSTDKRDPREWLDERIKASREAVARYAAEVEKEHQRVNEANEWVSALVRSLPDA